MSPILAVLAVVGVVGLGALAFRYAYPHAVETVTLRPAPFTVVATGPGTLDATNRVTISARVAGRLVDIRVDRNDVVVPDQILARLEAADLMGEIEAARATAQAAERAMAAAEAHRDSAKAAFANAQSTNRRQTELAAKGVAAQSGVDSALAAFRQAQAELAQAERSIEQSAAEEQSARAQIRVAQAHLDDTVVRAPFGGVVVVRERNVGDILTAGASLLQLVDPATIILAARFDESAMGAMRPGQPTTISFVSQPGREVTGRVLRLGRLVDEETREFTVDIALDALPINWALGQRGVAGVLTETRGDALTVPAAFIARRAGQAGVWAIEGGRARWRPVQLGASHGGRVEIRAGVGAGETVADPAGTYPFMKAREAAGHS